MSAGKISFTPFTEEMKKTHTILIPGIFAFTFFPLLRAAFAKLWL